MSGNERIARMEAQEIPPVHPAHQEGDTEVVVIGAGSTGPTDAAMLAGYGIRTIVLERAAGPAQHSRAAVVHAREESEVGRALH